MVSIDVHQAARNGNTQDIQAFLQAGGAACKLDCYDCEPLYYAVKHDQLEAAQLLLQHGGHVERNSKFRGDPIGAAVWNLNERMIRFTVSAGADVNRIRNGETPLDTLDTLRSMAIRTASADLDYIDRIDDIERVLVSLGATRSHAST